MADFKIEEKYYLEGKTVAGVDEAGRGPLAGPVVASAVIFRKSDEKLFEINDSKQLSVKKRDYLFDLITNEALDFAITFIDNTIIDQINILNASMLAMKLSIEKLKVKPDISLIDGNRFIYKELNYQTIIKGDEKSVLIAAASILSKVTRDKFMINQSFKYPEYEFDKNKGYGTAKHIQVLKNNGTCDLHRNSFLKNILGTNKSVENFNLF